MITEIREWPKDVEVWPKGGHFEIPFHMSKENNGINIHTSYGEKMNIIILKRS